MPEMAMPVTSNLKRNLGLWAIVALGLGYMTPTVVFDTFGMVAEQTNNVVPLAYLTALVVMIFTAISYGKMSAEFPNAGSAYTYAKNSLHPNVGFMVGWASMLTATPSGNAADHGPHSSCSYCRQARTSTWRARP